MTRSILLAAAANETPDDFKGNLVAFSETAKGAATNKTCEKHADWEG